MLWKWQQVLKKIKCWYKIQNQASEKEVELFSLYSRGKIDLKKIHLMTAMTIRLVMYLSVRVVDIWQRIHFLAFFFNEKYSYQPLLYSALVKTRPGAFKAKILKQIKAENWEKCTQKNTCQNSPICFRPSPMPLNCYVQKAESSRNKFMSWGNSLFAWSGKTL